MPRMDAPAEDPKIAEELAKWKWLFTVTERIVELIRAGWTTQEIKRRIRTSSGVNRATFDKVWAAIGATGVGWIETQAALPKNTYIHGPRLKAEDNW